MSGEAGASRSPDIYFIGFLVTPIPTSSGSLQVINQIGSFVTIDVPARSCSCSPP